MLHVTKAQYDHDFTIRVSFDDGTEGLVNLESQLQGPVFEPLQRVENFKNFTVDPELGTIVWMNGVDLAPEFLKDCLV